MEILAIYKNRVPTTEGPRTTEGRTREVPLYLHFLSLVCLLLTSLLRPVYHVDERPLYITTASLLPNLTESWSLRRSIPEQEGYLKT